jgi:hypothetical protein
MDLSILKKKISSYRTTKGSLTKVPDELAVEILYFWEQWSGPASGFYQAIGINPKKMASVLGKAKRLKREGFGVSEFKELQIEQETGQVRELTPCSGVEIVWKEGQLIRFNHLDLLVEFLKRAA